MSTTIKIKKPVLPSDPPSAVELRTSHLRRRHHLAPAVAAVIADLAYATSPSWVGRAAQ